jgi:hypothetical protein
MSLRPILMILGDTLFRKSVLQHKYSCNEVPYTMASSPL